MKRLMELLKDERGRKAFLADNKDMIVKVAAAMVLVFAAFFIFMFDGKEEEPSEIVEASAVEAEEKAPAIYVDIGGEVVTPMVVELEEGSRVEDAIEAAGGITDNADLTDINRAAFVEDGEKIFIPSLPVMTAADAVSEDGTGGYDAAPSYSDGRININTADSEELQQLNGVGPATAEKIIDYREEYGRFSSIEDIMNVSGIGEKTFEKFKDEIKV